jgi:hypothetical protein
MPCMSTPTVTEASITLESVTDDPFVADLDRPAIDADGRLAALLARAASPPRRRIYD